MKKLLLLGLLISTTCFLFAQTPIIYKGYVYDNEHNDRLASVNIDIFEGETLVVDDAKTNYEGEFNIKLPASGTYRVEFTRPAYQNMMTKITIDRTTNSEMAIPLTHLPDYEFTGIIKEFVSKDSMLGSGIEETQIDVYNKTTGQQILTLRNHYKPDFVVHFKKKNRYIILVRKEGYYAKRFDVVVDQDGCTICFEGLKTAYLSGVLDNHQNEELSGSMAGDIPLRPIRLNEIIEIENIYYGYDKANLRKAAIPALNNLVNVMRTTPIIIELSAHTDSRGRDEYNQKLSQARAQSAVDYIIAKGIDTNRITANGYGENRLVNDCEDGVPCTAAQHQQNRRTEFQVVKLMENSQYDDKTLKEIIILEKGEGGKA